MLIPSVTLTTDSMTLICEDDKLQCVDCVPVKFGHCTVFEKYR